MVLVIGGAGYIGSHFCKRLRQAGQPYVVFDNLENGHIEAVGDAPFVVGDIRQARDIERAFAEWPIDQVVHFGGYIEVGESEKDPAKFYWNNMTGLLTLLEVMRQFGVDELVFSSTAAVYGEPEEVPISEDHPTAPTSTYGWTKLAGEAMIASFCRSYGLRAVCLRYFNAAGADPEGELGEDHDPETHLIPRVILSALGRAPQITIFGTDYPTPDGTCIRDYVHVMDLAEAHLLALEHLAGGGESRTFNLGTGTGNSVLEVVRAVEAALGETVPVAQGERRAGDSAVLVAESTAAREELGWTPRYPGLADMVAHAAQWYRAHPTGYDDFSPSDPTEN